MNRSGFFDKNSAFATSLKALSILFVVALIALFTTHSSLPTGEVALVPAYVAVQQPQMQRAAPVPARPEGGAAKVAVPARL